MPSSSSTSRIDWPSAIKFLPGAREFDDEASLAGRLLPGREIFHMDVRLRPIRGRGLERLEHGSRTAAVKMRVLRRGAYMSCDIKKPSVMFIVKMELYVGHLFQ